MEFLIDRTALQAGLAHVAGIASSRDIVPILQNVLLDANGEILSLTATDLDIEATSRQDAHISRPGQITVQARVLADIVRRAENGAEISFSYDPAADPRALVRVGRSKYTLPVLPAADFPSMKDLGESIEFEVQPADLARLIDLTKHAVSSEETRYCLCGGYLHIITDDEGLPRLRIAATDGHRAAYADMPAPDGAEAMPQGLIIPNKSLLAMRQMLDIAKAPARIEVSKAMIAVHCGHASLISKTIDGSFPDYQRIIPLRPFDTTGRINGAVLAKGIDRAGIMSTEKVRAMKCLFGGGKLALSTRNEIGGVAETELALDESKGEATTGFNAKYLHDLAAVFGDQAMDFNIDPSGPCRVDNPADSACAFVIMPLRV